MLIYACLTVVIVLYIDPFVIRLFAQALTAEQNSGYAPHRTTSKLLV